MHKLSTLVISLGLALALQAAFSGELEASWFWTQSDWSGGAYASADSVDAEVEPGELVLAGDPDQLIPAFDPTALPGVWAMAVWRGKLYMGACTFPMSVSDGDILIYDCASDSSWIDYPVYEQGICVLRTHEDRIFSPGPDNLGTHFLGNLYLNEGGGWLRKETIPQAVHVDDVAFWDDRIWVTTGTAIFPDFPGVLYSSSDLGDTWVEELRVVPVAGENFRRLYGAYAWNGSLFVQTDWKAPEGKRIFELTGTSILNHTVEASGDECLAGFAEFHGELVVLTRTIVDFYDGQSWDWMILPAWSQNWVCRALIVYQGRLYLGGYQGLHASADRVNWTPIQVSPLTGREFESLAQYHGRLYAGTLPNGEVFVTPAAGTGMLVSLAHAFPAPICEGTLSFNALEPPGTNVRFQLRSAPSEAELASAEYLGPDGSGGSWYEASGTAMAAAHCGHRWFQYRALLETGDPRLAPVLEEIVLEVDNTGTGVPGDGTWTPGSLAVWPNPFVSELRVALSGPAGGRLRVYDPQGRCVRDLGQAAPGQALIWDGRDARGSRVSAGIYLLQVEGAAGPGPSQRVLRLH